MQLWIKQEIAWNCWDCMRLHEIAWYCMKLHEIAWDCMRLHEIVWDCIRSHKIAWDCMRLYEIAQDFKRFEEISWACKKFQEFWLVCTRVHKFFFEITWDFLRLQLKVPNFILPSKGKASAPAGLSWFYFHLLQPTITQPGMFISKQSKYKPCSNIVGVSVNIRKFRCCITKLRVLYNFYR